MPVWKRLTSNADYKAIDFTIVYIMEAHAEIVRINQHKTNEDRLNAARTFAKTFSFGEQDRILVDDMDNSFNEQFAAWPFRYYVLDGKEIKLIGMPEASGNGDTFSEKPLLEYLERFVPVSFKPKMRHNISRGSTARMLHYSSGRKGFNDLKI